MEKLIHYIQKMDFEALENYLSRLKGRQKKAHTNLLFSYKYYIAKQHETNLDLIALMQQNLNHRNYEQAHQVMELLKYEDLSDLEKIYFLQLKAFLLYYSERDIPSAVMNLEMAKQISLTHDLLYFEAKFSLLLGIYQLSITNSDIAKYHLTQALNLYSKYDNPIFSVQKAKAQLNLGTLASTQNDYDEAIEKTTNAACTFLELQDFETYVSASINLALNYKNKNMTEIGISHLEDVKKKVKKIEQPLKDILKLKIFQRLAELNYQIKDLDKTLYYGKKIINTGFTNLHKGIGFRYIALTKKTIRDIDMSLKYLEFEPQHELIESYIVKSDILLKNCNYIESAKILKDALIKSIEYQYNPTSLRVLQKYLEINRNYISAKDSLTTLSNLNSLIEDLDSDNSLLLELAWTYLYNARFTDCNEILEKCQNAFPGENSEIRAIMALSQGEIIEAKEQITDSLTSYDNQIRHLDSFHANFILSLIYLHEKDERKISKFLNTLKKLKQMTGCETDEIALVEVITILFQEGILIKYKGLELTDGIIQNKSKVFNQFFALLLRIEIIQFEIQLTKEFESGTSYLNEMSKELERNIELKENIIENFPLFKLLNTQFVEFPLTLTSKKLNVRD